MVRFETKLFKISDWTILKLPQDASAQLPSRGQTMVKGTIDGFRFQTALEPDGRGSHWFRFNKDMRKATGADAGDTVTLEMESTKDWPEPKVPADLNRALGADTKACDLWLKITPLARWDWIRWVRGTAQAETRQRRIEVALSKLKAGERRPCCFNRAACTEPAVSKGGQLLVPDEIAA